MVTVQFTRFTNINNDSKEDNVTFGYRIYNEEKSEYNNSFITVDELSDNLCEDKIMTYLQDYHPDFYEMITIDREFELNGEIIEV